MPHSVPLWDVKLPAWPPRPTRPRWRCGRPSRRRARQLASADQVRRQLKRAIGAGRHLPPQPESDVDPTSLSNGGFDERALFPSLVVVERLIDLKQIDVVRISSIEEIRSALLHPALPDGLTDFVRIM